MNLRTATTNPILYIVATPIGNRGDITLRAIEILKKVDFILAEDTRHSKPFLDFLGIKKPIISLHEHNEEFKKEEIIKRLCLRQSAALISDAGTPLISDPGYLLVNLARKNNIDVIPIPGASAVITALSAAGKPCDTFTFAGFLPNKKNARVTKLQELKKLKHTLVFYESSHRILKCITDVGEVFGNNFEIVLAKELTKTFENFISGDVTNLLNWLDEDPNHCKGEFVVIIPAKEDEAQTTNKNIEIEQTLTILLNELPLKQAVKITSLLTQHNKNEIYKIAIKLKKT